MHIANILGCICNCNTSVQVDTVIVGATLPLLHLVVQCTPYLVL